MADVEMNGTQNPTILAPPGGGTTLQSPTSAFDRGSSSIPKFFGDVPKLEGKKNYVQWSHRVQLALLKTRSARFINPNDVIPTDMIEAQMWYNLDGEIAACILDTTADHIATACMYFITDVEHQRRASDLWAELQRVYGTTGAQQAFALGRQFIQSKCGTNDHVVTWVDKVMTQYQELKVLKFDLDNLCINVLLSGLPRRFEAFIDQIWTDETSPTVEELRAKILRIDSAHESRKSFPDSSNSNTPAQSTALVSRTNTVTTSDTTLESFYAGLRKAGKGPSKEHPCSRCGSSGHWVVDCKKKPLGRRGKKKETDDKSSNDTKPTEQAAVAELSHYPSETALVMESTDSPRSSDDWILDSGATEHMTGDASLLEDVRPPPKTTTVSTADGILDVTGVGVARLLNGEGQALRLAQVYLVRGLRYNLMSVRQFTAKGAAVGFKDNKAKVVFDGRTLLEADLRQRTWVVNASPNEPLNRICLALPA